MTGAPSRRRLLVALLAGPAIGALPAFAQTPAWDATLAKARGQTVYWWAWAGDERTNAFIAWTGEHVKARFGVGVQHVKLRNTAEAVAKVVAEKAAGRDAGRLGRSDLDQRPELPRDEGAEAPARAVRGDAA